MRESWAAELSFGRRVWAGVFSMHNDHGTPAGVVAVAQPLAQFISWQTDDLAARQSGLSPDGPALHHTTLEPMSGAGCGCGLPFAHAEACPVLTQKALTARECVVASVFSPEILP